MQSNAQDEKKHFERIVDEVLLARFELDPNIKMVTGIALEVFRTLRRLSEKEGVPLDRMDRSFLIQHLAHETIDVEEERAVEESVWEALKADNSIEAIRALIKGRRI
jgi:hypothetical protein